MRCIIGDKCLNSSTYDEIVRSVGPVYGLANIRVPSSPTEPQRLGDKLQNLYITLEDDTVKGGSSLRVSELAIQRGYNPCSGGSTRLDKYVHIHEDLQRVVHDHGDPQVEPFSMFHKLWTPFCDEIYVGS